MKTYISSVLFGALVILGSFVTIAGQQGSVKVEDAVKGLKRSMVSNSRYIAQGYVVNFQPIEFKDCSVTYTYATPSSAAAGNYGQEVLDPTSQDSVLIRSNSTATRGVDTRSGNSSGVNIRSTPPLETRRASNFFNQQFISMKLGDLDLSTIKIDTNARSAYLLVRTKSGLMTITHSPKGIGTDPEEFGFEVIPVVSEKDAAKIKSALTTAVKACQAVN